MPEANPCTDVTCEVTPAPEHVPEDVPTVADFALAEKRKLQARLRQQKCRAKAKELQVSIQAKLDELQAQVAEARRQAEERRLQVCQARARLQAATLQQQQASLGRELPAVTLPALLEVETRPPQPPQPPRVPRATPPSVSAGPRPCSIFRKADNAGRKLQHRARISLRRVVTEGWQTAFDEDMIILFREQIAQRLGCHVSDICWLVENENCPALTRDGLVTSHLDTPACTAKVVAWWMATMFETALLLAMEKRFNQPLPAAAHPLDTTYYVSGHGMSFSAPPQPAKFAGGAHEGSAVADELLEPDQVAPEPSSLEESMQALAHQMHSVLLSTKAEEQGRGRASEWQMQLPSALQTTCHVQAIVESVFTEMLQKYIPQMHPADVLSVCKRVQRGFSLPSRLADLPPLPEMLTPDIVLPVVMQGTCHAILKCMHDLRMKPMVPSQPATPAAVERALAAVHQQLRLVSLQWAFAFYTIAVDRPSIMRGMASSTNTPNSGATQFEMSNLAAYKAMNMTAQQKAKLLAFWKAHQAATRKVDAVQDGLVAQLAALPSEEDLPSTNKMSLTFNAPASSYSRVGGTRMPEAPPVHLLGVSAEATETAASILSGLRDCLNAKNDIYARQYHAYRMYGPVGFSATQEAEWFTSVMPLLPDLGRIVQMAAHDLRCMYTFGKLPICAGTQSKFDAVTFA